MKTVTALAISGLVLLSSTHAAETTVAAGDKPYVVSLRFSQQTPTGCAGLLITPKHVLTAAHCTNWSEYALVGELMSEGAPTTGEVLRIVKKTRHPKNVDVRTYSFTIFELERASTFTPVALADRDASAYAGNMTSSYGWNQSQYKPPPTNAMLRTTQTVHDDAACSAADPSYASNPSIFCAGGTENDNKCRGDTGGPIVVEREGKPDVVLGTVLNGDGCGAIGAPGMYTRAYQAKSWIEANAPGVQFE